ncbi:hypothetical protein VP01_7333g1, partial [Puccinia sorghi]
VGTASNGKLKASEWHSLFAKHLPLVSLEAFGSVCLIECTHFIKSKSITEDSCSKFDIYYKSYCRTSEALFKGISIRPNHHYAIHIGQLSQIWGPLINLSEFRGERLNGMLQSLSTNNLLGQMEGSMMKCFCQIQRLAHKKEFSKLSMNSANKNVNTHLTLEIYEVLYEHLKKTHPNLRDYREIPHPIGAKVLTRNVTKINQAEIQNRLQVSTKKPQNGVWWDCNGQRSFGFVIDIFRVPDLEDGSTQVVIKRTDLVDLRQVADVDFEWLPILSQMKVAVGVVAPDCYNLIHASSIGGQCLYQELSLGVIGNKFDLIGNKFDLVLWMAVELLTLLDPDPMELRSMVVD